MEKEQIEKVCTHDKDLTPVNEEWEGGRIILEDSDFSAVPGSPVEHEGETQMVVY